MPSAASHLLAAAAIAALLSASALAQQPPAPSAAPKLPIFFVSCDSAAPDAPAFVGRAGGFSAAFHRDRLELVRSEADRTARVALHFVGAAATPESAEALPGKLNLLVGAPEQWRANLPLHAALRYRALWPGVDLVVHGVEGALQYDLHFAAGAALDPVAFRVEGAAEVRVDVSGALVMRTALGEMSQRPPLTWEVASDGSRVIVPSRFELRGDGSYGFAVQRVDAARPLVVDPVLGWASYFGSTSDDVMNGLAVDAAGCVYLGGTTPSLGALPTPGAHRTSGSDEGFVAKLDPSLSGAAQLQWCTLIGGTGADELHALALRSSGTLLVTGIASAGFGVSPGAYASSGPAYLAELSADGTTLLYATRLGGISPGRLRLALEPSGRVLLAGTGSGSPGYTTTAGAYQPANAGGIDLWFGRMDLALSGSAQLVWASHFGGPDDEVLADFAPSATEAGVFTFLADTRSGAACPQTHGSGSISEEDLLVGRFDTTLSGAAQLRFAHVAGAAAVGVGDRAGALALAPDASVFVACSRATGGGASDAALLHFASSGASVLSAWSWAPGGALLDVDLHRSADGTLTLVGATNSAVLPSTPTAIQASFAGGGADLYVAQLDASTSQVIFGSYLGSSALEVFAEDVSALRSNVLTLGARASAAGGLPTQAPFATAAGGSGNDVYLARLELPAGADPAAGIGPRDIVLLDLDGDGDLDLATANAGSDNLGLRTNGGAGVFGSEQTVALTAGDDSPVALARGDLDGDGSSDDLAVACETSSTVVLVTNAGSVSRSLVSLSIAGSRGSSVACGDLDANPQDDVVVGREGLPLAGGRGIALSLNGGAFASLTIPAPHPTQVVAVALGDLDGDGDADLAAVARGASDALLLFAGDGAGALSFAAALPLATSGLASGLTLADLDRDGRADLAVAQPVLFPPSQSLRIYRRTSSGALGAGLFASALDLATSGSFATDL
ncbi:MAG: VCBS repeat-containing protein, partial [Planctomycetes bacterium]|nr:VCBS repeat-containing protein [Planctomycetota bacterium]